VLAVLDVLHVKAETLGRVVRGTGEAAVL